MQTIIIPAVIFTKIHIPQDRRKSMMQIVLKVAGLTVAAFCMTFIVSLLLGRKLISQMTFFDFVVGIILGSATVNAAVDQSNTSLSGFVIVIVVFLLTMLLDIGHVKSFLIQKTAGSEPVTVIENGKINNKNMRRIRL